MDGRAFDTLTRRFASGSSRRSLLRAGLAIVGAAVGLGAGDEVDAARKLRKLGQVCRDDGDCESGVCGPPDRTGRGRCACGGPADCPQPNAGDPCRSVTCSAEGVCAIVVNVGAPCGDGNACMGNAVCQADGTCVGTPVVCTGGKVCAGGACVCPAGQIDCGAGCVPGDCCHVQGPYNHPVFGTVYYDPRCDDGISCTFDHCIDHQCVHVDVSCDDGKDCTVDFCDHELKRCVNVPIGGAPGLTAGMCDLGEFLPDGWSCYADYLGGAEAGSGWCESQYCDPDTGLCAPNPNPCTKQGLACTSDAECCFGLPCTRGYCRDGN